MSEEKLRELIDRTVREITWKATGINLKEEICGPQEELYTIHIGFKRGLHSSLSLQADAALLTHLARAILRKEDVSYKDVEDVSKEYLNILCGHISRALYRDTRVSSRFGVPSFHEESFAPEGQKVQFTLYYSDDKNHPAQVVHYIPDPPAGGEQGEIKDNRKRRCEMKKRVMVVDDSRIQEVQMRNLLKDSDYEVVAYCRNGEEALASYGEVKPDVVTMDIIMPGLDGLETATALLEEHPEARIIMVSSLAYDETFDEAKEIGAKGFLDKPFDQEKLLAALDHALEG